MKSAGKWMLVGMLGVLPAACGGEPELEEEIADVVEEHQDVVEQAEQNPQDTAALAREIRERDREQEEAADVTRRRALELQDTTVR